jgi:hypothetical protein
LPAQNERRSFTEEQKEREEPAVKIEVVEIAIGVFTLGLAFTPGIIRQGSLTGSRGQGKPFENQKAARLAIFTLGLAELADGTWRVFFS